mmetsp:Transcript_17872/g.42762  ORF Transcript_17872/g.42762 Transcript_17872/m.42762 type:complete len:673 (-) Transcript_17872:186-2204(-)
MSSNQEIHMIVDRLREYKFEEDLTLVTFHQKTPQELLETLNNVFKHLSKEHDVDLRDEPIETTAYRMLGFLPILLYNYEGEVETFKQGIANGDKDMIYPILKHLLSKLPELRKRAYLSRFLTAIEVPEEMFADPEIMEKYQQYKELQESFKETHKATERLRGTTLQPTELKREVAQLEEEKTQLKGKIAKLEQKLRKLDNFEELYEVTSKLRKEQEEEAKLGERFQEQAMQLKQSEARYYQARGKLQDVEAASSEGGSGEDLLQKLEDDVRMTRKQCLETLPADIEAKQKRSQLVHKIIQMPPVTDFDIEEMQSKISRLNSAISELVERQQRQAVSHDGQLGMFSKQAQVVARKKSELYDRLKMQKEELKEVEQDLSEKRDKLGTKAVKVLKGPEFARYADSLKLKAKEYKKKKGELSSIIAEKGILSRTEDILKTRHGDQTDFLASLEKQKGVQGAAQLQTQLEQVSEQTAEVNQTKALTLEDISKTVQEINNTIKEKKSKLAPLIKELRQVRSDFSLLETEYNEKKAVYENTAVGLDAERDKLNTEVAAVSEECRREESRFHYLHAMIASTRILLDRAAKEDAGKNRIGDANQSYRELYQSRVQQQENLSKTLRERQKMVKESHEANLEQANMFRDLRKILGAKMVSLKKEMEEDGADQGATGTNLLVMD